MGGYIKVDKMDVEWVTDDVNHWVIGSESVIGTGPHSVTIPQVQMYAYLTRDMTDRKSVV